MKLVKRILGVLLISILVLIGIISYPYLRWQMQLMDRKDDVDQSLSAILRQTNCDSYKRRETREQGKSVLIVEFANCDSMEITSDLKEKARFSAERLTLAIFDNEFDEVRCVFWSRRAKIDSISFDPKDDF